MLRALLFVVLGLLLEPQPDFPAWSGSAIPRWEEPEAYAFVAWSATPARTSGHLVVGLSGAPAGSSAYLLASPVLDRRPFKSGVLYPAAGWDVRLKAPEGGQLWATFPVTPADEAVLPLHFQWIVLQPDGHVRLSNGVTVAAASD